MKDEVPLREIKGRSLFRQQKKTVFTVFALKGIEQEKERIRRALEQANGNRNAAARLLGIGHTTLYRKMQEYGML